MRGLLADLRHAFQLYRRTPVSSAIVVAVLAASMAFVTSFLSLYVDQVLRPHPGFEQSGRLVTLGQSDGASMIGLPYPLIERMASEATILERVVGVQNRSLPIGPDAQSDVVEFVTEGFFSGMRPRVALGRGLEATEHQPDADRVVVVSDRYWRQKLGANADVIGTTLSLWFYFRAETGAQGGPMERRPVDFRIVGIMAPEMPGVLSGAAAGWVSIEATGELFGNNFGSLQSQSVVTFGRRVRGATVQATIGEMDARYGDSPSELGLDPGRRLDATAGVVRSIEVQRDLARQLRLLLAGSLLIAFVAACNVSLYLLARAPGRRREIAIRLAVGAPLKRIARQLASEAGLLVLAAAVPGILLSAWLSGLLQGLPFLDAAQWRAVSLFDWRVLALVGALLLLLALLVAIVPVAGLKRFGIAASSRAVTGRATPGQRLAGTAQMAITGTVAAAAIAFGAHLAALMFGDPGYSTRDRYAVAFEPGIPSAPDFGAGVANAIVEFTRRRDALLTVPGITRASFGGPVPGAQLSILMMEAQAPDDPTRNIRYTLGMVDRDYVDLLGLRLVSGRAPAEHDGTVAVANQALAREVWGREDVVGEKLPLFGGGFREVEIVGVLADLPMGHPNARAAPTLFVTAIPNFYFSSVAVIESTLPARELEGSIRTLTDAGGLELGVRSVTSLRELRMRQLRDERARGALTIGAAIVVVILAGFGFQGIQRYLVSAGRREYAVRASLGAGPKALGRLVVRRGLMLGLPGLALGAMLSFITVSWLRDDFVSRDVSAFAVTAVVAAGLVLLLAAASFGPARQAMRTQPAPLLREE